MVGNRGKFRDVFRYLGGNGRSAAGEGVRWQLYGSVRGFYGCVRRMSGRFMRTLQAVRDGVVLMCEGHECLFFSMQILPYSYYLVYLQH